jgi:acetyl esterase/lipase
MRESNLPVVVALVLAVGSGLAAPAAGQLQPTHSDLVYATIGPGQLRLDLYLPAGAEGATPCVIWIHGGGWAGGSKYPIPGWCATLVTQHGFAVASVDYRLTTQAAQFGGAPVIFPAQIHDVKGAVRWLRAHAATYNLDPLRFGSAGSSAGGHLSALLGTSAGVSAAEGVTGGNTGFSSAVQACLDYFGPTDLLMMNLDVTVPPGSTIDHDAPSSPESHLVGWDDPGQGIGDIRANLGNPNPPYPQLAGLCVLANPIAHVDTGDPRFMIAHGTDDTLVPIRQSERLHDALGAAGVANEYIIVQGAGHGGFPMTVYNEAIVFFLEELAAPAGDLNGDGAVDVADLLELLAAWGDCARPCPPACAADLDGSCAVDVGDLLILLADWS